MPLKTLTQRIADRTAKVGVVGLGYVGLPFAVEKAKVGFAVTGIEQNPKRAEQVNRGQSYIADVDSQELKRLVKAGLIRAVTTFDSVAELDVVVICVPTPLTKNLAPDLSYVESVTRHIAQHLRKGQLISLESTTYPGTTEEVMLPILEAGSGLKADRDFFLAHSPERVDPGNKRYTTKNTNKVVGGVGPNSLKVAKQFYSQTIDHVVPVSSAKAAELVKVYENTFRAVNIALANELALLCDKLNLNVWEVLDAAFTKPFGIMPFYPGPGVGGHCIPIDPHYLEWKAKEYNFNTHFIALAGEVNRRMPEFVVEKLTRTLNKRKLALNGAHLLFLGVAYKADLADERESPALEVMAKAAALGAKLKYHDTYIPTITIGGKTLRSTPLTPAAVRAADVVVLTTAHSDIDYPMVAANAKAILDTRNGFAAHGIRKKTIELL